MTTATRKHLYVQGGLARFAQVTVARMEENDIPCTAPLVRLNDYIEPDSEVTSATLSAAQTGIREAETERMWAGLPHCLVSVEGLLVDGIDCTSARIAASLATRELINAAAAENLV